MPSFNTDGFLPSLRFGRNDTGNLIIKLRARHSIINFLCAVPFSKLTTKVVISNRAQHRLSEVDEKQGEVRNLIEC